MRKSVALSEMKQLILLFVVLLAGVQAPAQNSFRADSKEITYIGRVVRADGTVTADWSGTTAVVTFQGRTLTMNYDEARVDYVNIWIDREPDVEADAVLKLETGAHAVELCNFKKKGTHTVYIQKRTEGETGCITFRSFNTDGVLLPSRPWKKRIIEIVGDSYTCGLGVEAPDSSSPARAEEENCNKSYSGILGRFFDADVVRISHSGRGIVRNYNDGDPAGTMPVRYLRALDEKENPVWEPSYHPDIVVIYLGTNDFSVRKQPYLETWRRSYQILLEEIRAFHGDEVPILCVASSINALLGDYVKEAALHCGLPGVYWAAISKGAHNDQSDMGAIGHPNYWGMRKVAACMAPYIATLTGWELPAIPLQ